MILPSGKVITDEDLREIADDWSTLGFQEEHAVDIEESFAEELEGKGYDEGDRCVILTVVREVVIDVVGELKEHYGKLYKEHIATKCFGGEAGSSALHIMFTDLTEDAQRRVLEFHGIEAPEDANWDIIPIAVLERDD